MANFIALISIQLFENSINFSWQMSIWQSCNFKKSVVFSIAAIFLIISNVSGQIVLKGQLTDIDNGHPLAGASVVLKGSNIGTMADEKGKFELPLNRKLPLTLVFSYLGYNSKDIVVENADQLLRIKLTPNAYNLEEVTVISERLTIKQKESPLTVESMDVISIQQTPSANFYDGLGLLKGVDLTAASLGFKIVNTRGFNSTRPVRSLQIIDGVDNQAPGLNFSLGNFLGSSELDVMKVEIIAGASSAMFGPNAFNGVISMQTKNPFIHPGLTVMTKVGERYLFEQVFRYAKVLKNKKGDDKMAFKINFSYLRANDWEATNYQATEQSLVGEDNWGGYDAVNMYGDENITTGANNFTDDYGRRNFPGLGIYYRSGYKERDLVDYNTNNLKLGAGLYFKLNPDVEANYCFNFGTGTTVYQGDNRYSLKDIKFYQHKAEISKKDDYFIRAYHTSEDAGNSYDAVFTAILMQNAAKNSKVWSNDYNSYWSKIIPQVRKLPGFPPLAFPYQYEAADMAMQANSDQMRQWHQEARNYADRTGNPQFESNPYYEPGTARFDSLFRKITSKTTFLEGGSMFYDKSALMHIQAEKKFQTSFLDIILGGSYRNYRPVSRGTIFSDTGGSILTNYEYGFYSWLEKRVWNDKLILTAIARLDKNENYSFNVSPAVSAVYKYDDQSIFRLSFSSAIRNPTLQDQFLYYNVGRAILIGNINGFDSLVTIPSLYHYFDYLDHDTLEYFNVPPVRPERVKSVEIGYKGTLFDRLFIDASYYFSIYRDFLGYKIGAQVFFDTSTSIINKTQVYRVSANSPDQVRTQGFSIGLNYFLGKYYMLSGNYSWNMLDRLGSDDPIIPAFNTPAHKFNIGFSGRDISAKIKLFNKISNKIPIVNLRNFGFNLNYKWIQGFLFEGSPQFTGFIPTYDLVDAQVNYAVPRIHTTFKLGASNLLNKLSFQTYGGPYIGRIIYFSILFDMD